MRPLVLLVGPTAGGKTSLAIDLALRLPGGGECISADSMQVYRGMDIGTAKPAAKERAAAPHHLLDLVDPGGTPFNVEDWLEAATAAIEEIRGRGRWPIVVGGTNLYVQALLFGLFDGPPADPARRSALAAMDAAALVAHLANLDPDAAARMHPNARRRIIRAIEVHEATGTPIGDLQSQWASSPRSDAIVIGLTWATETINGRINARVRAMMERGLLEETQSLLDAGHLQGQASQALGYKQLMAHLAGDMTLEEAVEQVKILTRRFAKQQRTWLRRFATLPNAAFIAADELSPQATLEQSVAHILSRVDASPAA